MIIHSILIVFSIFIAVVSEKGVLKGCFKHSVNNGQIKSNSASAYLSVDKCIDACIQVYNMYAIVQEAKYCFCGSKYDAGGVSENCTMECAANKTQICGGVESDSVYVTGLMIPGPVKDFVNTSSTDVSIQLRWNPPDNINGGVKSYKIKAQVLHTFDKNNEALIPLEWTYPNTSFKQSITGLIPGTEYNVSILPTSDFGDGPAVAAIFWTEVGYPKTPPPPEILSKDTTKTMKIKLPLVDITTGPITAYQIIVYDESGYQSIVPDKLTNQTEAKRLKIPYYITAILSPNEATRPFVVGDGATYSGYLNAPLDEEKTYTVVLGVLSTLHGLTRASYSKPAVHFMHFGGNIELTTMVNHNGRGGQKSGNSSAHDSLVIGLSVAIGIGLLMLLASVVVFLLMRRRTQRVKRSADHQELTVHQTTHSEASDSGGIASSVLFINDETDLAQSFDAIKTRLWMIPRSHLEISDHILGEGKFGQLKNGIVHKDGLHIPILIHTCSSSLPNHSQRILTSELDAMMQMGSHTNAVAIVGLCEEETQLHVTMEQHVLVLKDVLLESRALDYYPVFAEKHGKMSTFKEEQLIEFALGVAQGMAHLVQNKIIHGRLCAWHVKVVEKTIPKLTHFGLAQYEDNAEKIDYSRWSSLESLRGKYSSKSDVWSFGVLLWEIVTLGATPYGTVKSKDVSARIIRGMRLKQMDYLGDDLYQLMLQCWQIDPDERPSFSEVVNTLRTMLTSDFVNMGHLRLFLYPDFQYEKYEIELEKTSLTSVQV